MPAKSKSQQRLFGMVTAYKEGKLKLDDLAPSLAKKIKSIADGSKKKTGDKRKKTKGITKKAAADYASTKHKGLPQKVKESFDFDRNEIIDIIYIYSKFDMNELQEMTDKELLDLYTTLEVDNFEDEIQQPEEDMYDTYYETHIKRASDFLNEGKDDEGYMDALEGGEAEDMTIEDIAKMHNVPVKYIENIMPSAIEIELEHTDDPEVAARIALDHLAETPLYYDDVIGLPNMEDELEDLDDEEIEEVISKKIKKYDDFDEEEKEVKTNEELDTSISTPEETIGKEASDILWAIENKDKEGYRHLFDKYMKELERAGGDKKIFDTLPTDMDKTAYLLGLIYKQNYGEEQMKKKLEEVDPQKISAPFNTWVAASVAALKELGIEGIAKKAKTNESSIKKFNNFK